ncbi:MAG: hypothetical protein HKO59_16260 [Phycisphaerales bacterium]|nr:hypothetical protein [Phycisphaerae bacterium]NNF44655.1 hypothetical protein [Phycisphaerales bacterium]NNM27505.1 hypothetical protein [Phycisphaerales bacterium]
MSKASPRKRKSHAVPARKSWAAYDRSIYLGLIIIGAAVAAFAWLVWTPQWRPITLGYIIAVAWLVNLYAVSAYQGKHLANWKQALARLPLRFAGFGSRGGKPVDAAHEQPAAKMMIFVSIAVSVLVVLGLTYWLIPAVRVA